MTAHRRLHPRVVAALAAAVSLAGLGVATSSVAAVATESDPPAAFQTDSAVGAAISAPGFLAVAPRRLLDTRATTGGPQDPASTVSVQVTGVAAVPSTGVTAVVLNVTAIAHTHSTFVTVYPAGTSRPNASNVNVALGATRANQVIAMVGAGGQVSLYNSSGSTDLIVDITGYFTAASSYSGQSPSRVLDTRLGGGAPVPAATVRTVQVAGNGGVPAGVSAVVLNLTGISTQNGTFVTAFPGGTARPLTSNLNLVAGQTAAVLVIAQLSDAGELNLYNSGGPTHLILDVEGWFTGAQDYLAVRPTRLVDTRGRDVVPYGQDTPVAATTLGHAPPGSGAAVLSVTAVNPSATGYVTVHAAGTAVPVTSSLNAMGGGTVANLVVTQLSPGGAFAIYDRAPGADIVVDVVGWLRTNRALAFPTPGIGPGEVGQPYTATLRQTGGLAPYTWVLVAGALPDGLTLSASTGEISGTPTTAGTDSATVRVRDSSGQSVQRVLTFTTYPFVSATPWGWGGGGSGQLPVTGSPVPQQLSALTGVKEVAGGSSVGLAVLDDGTVWTWGGNQLANTGPPDGIPASAPVQIPSLTGVESVAVGSNTNYALLSDGTVWAWGQGASGALGNGDTADSDDPVPVSGLTDVVAVSGGTQSGYAVKSDGTVWAWGANLPAVMGNAGADTSLVPRRVSGLGNVVSVAAGADDGYAVKTDGTVWAWGEGGSGQLGNSSSADTRTPGPVDTLTGVVQIAAGSETGYALSSDGTVWAWGEGANGELGDGGPADAATPVQVPGLSGVTQIAAGSHTAYGLLDDGTVWAWGSDSSGQLGDGLPSPSTVASPPTEVVIPPVGQISANWSSLSAFAVGPA